MPGLACDLNVRLAKRKVPGMPRITLVCLVGVCAVLHAGATALHGAKLFLDDWTERIGGRLKRLVGRK